ncbi:MAG: GNAT family N-acetyltransferase [Acidimicrobiales bacterium]
MEIRGAAERDADAIRSIYNAEVLTSLATLDVAPRSEAEHLAWMSAHAGVYPVLVGVGGTGSSVGVGGGGGEVVGFSALSPYRPRSGYSTAVENSVYVAAAHRGKGLGRSLLEAIVEAAVTHGFHSIVARISTEQLASISLHKATGFEMVGVEREIGRKFGRWVDVAILQRML